MAKAEPESSQTQPPSIPDYMLNPDAVLHDASATWRHDTPPDYTNTRKVWSETKQSTHAPASLESMVENLVKNWEIEASHKLRVSDWRTIDPEVYTFSVNGSPPQDANHMLKVGTYNAILASSGNAYYSPSYNDLDASHAVFRNMMPTFAWEVVEVYSPPPVVAFKWRHWGEMKGDYVGVNNKNEKVTVKAHSKNLDIRGVTVVKVKVDDGSYRVQSLETWFDPLELFNQMSMTAEDDGDNKVERGGMAMEERIDQTEHPLIFDREKVQLLDTSVTSDNAAEDSRSEDRTLDGDGSEGAKKCPFAGAGPAHVI